MEKNIDSLSDVIASKRVTLKSIMIAYKDRKSSQTPKIKILADAATTLKSLQHSLNEDKVQKEKQRSKLLNDIDGLKIGILQMNKKIERAEARIVESGNKVEDFMETIRSDEKEGNKNDQDSKEEEFEKKLEKGKQEIYKIMDLKKKKDIDLLKMEITKKIIDAKTTNKKICLTCGHVNDDLFICENCNDAFYCNEKCQKNHWFIHTHYCRRTDRFKHKQQQQQPPKHEVVST